MKKIAFFMALLLLVESTFPVYANAGSASATTSFTIDFNQTNRNSDSETTKNSANKVIPYSEKSIVKNYFVANEMDTDYYQSWLDNQNEDGLSSVTSTIVSKGAPIKSKDLYHQYYTQHYYDTTTLIKLVKNAYLNGKTSFEVYDTYAASTGGYTLKNRTIAKSKYLEYENRCE